ncbi:cell division protein PerM [Micromonospora echinospora]
MSSVTPDQPRRPAGVDPDGRPDGRAGPVPRPRPRRPGGADRADTPRRRRAPLAVAAVVAAGWAALTSYLPVAVVLGLMQLSEDAASVVGALRAGLAGWLLGHGVPLDTSAGPLGLAPLALTALVVWRLTRAGVHTTRALGARGTGAVRPAFVAAGAVGLGYALLGVLAALGADTAGTSLSPLRAGVTLGLVGVAAALVGALRTTGAPDRLLRRVPTALHDGVRTGLVAGLLLAGAGAGAAGLAIATGGGDAADMIGAYRTGVAGQAGITLVSLAYAPNAAIWATSYLLGPGFAVGTDTAVRTSEVSVGALPAVPLLAGLPRGPVDGLGALLLAVPVLIGMAAGWLLARRLLRSAADDRTPLHWGPLLGTAALAGPVAGLLVGAAAAVSGGPLGGGRLAEVGPVAWQVTAVATAVVTVGALLGAAATRAFTRQPAPRP